MKDKNKSKEQLIKELTDLRRQVVKLAKPSRAMSQTQPAMQTGAELRKNYGHLEQLVKERTAELTQANEQLQRQIIERRQAEEKLQKERDRAQNYLDIAGVIIVAIDTNQKVTLINRKGCKTLGYSEKEIVGQNWFDLALPDRDKEPTKATFTKLMAGEIEPVEYYENPVLTKGGEERIIAWHNTVLRNSEGEIISTLSSGEDITERKKHEKELEEYRDHLEELVEKRTGELIKANEQLQQEITERVRAEEALRKSEERLRGMVNASPDLIFLFDEEGRYLEILTSQEQLLVESTDVLLGKSVTDTLPNRLTQRFLEALKHTTESGNPETIEYELDVITGRRWFEGRLAPVSQHSDDKRTALFVSRDITERKQAEAALQESEERFRRLSEAAFEGIAISDQGRIIDVNRRLAEMLGYAEQIPELLEMEAMDFVAPESRDLVLNHIRSGYDKPYKHLAIRKDGTVFPVEVRGKALPYAGRQLRVTAIRDITERVQAEEALRESERKFRNIVEHIPLGMHMYQLEPDGKLIFTGANPAADRILGFDNNQFVGKTIEEAFPSSVETELPERYRTAASTGETWQTDQIIYEDKGISGAFSVYAFQTSPGKMVAAFLDITRRKQIEQEREKLIVDLQEALARVKKLSGLLPICANCKKIRDDEGYWQDVAIYIRNHSEADFSHGICPDCAKELYPGFFEE